MCDSRWHRAYANSYMHFEISHGSSNATTEVIDAQPLAGILDQALFEELYPNAIELYSFDGLVAAVNSPIGTNFLTEGTEEDQKRELAAFLAQTAHESGDFVYAEEIAYAGTQPGDPRAGDYCGPNLSCDFSYHGRGPIQLSWNYNYDSCGTGLGIDLLGNPNLVIGDSTTAWQTALWFWNTHHVGQPDSIHNLMVSGAGFAFSTDIINGGIECGTSPTNSAAEVVRIANYENLCERFGIAPGDNLSCQTAAFDPPEATDPTLRCGGNFTDVASKCGTFCDGTDALCPDGERCFVLDATICTGENPNQDPTIRCGIDSIDADGKCGTFCDGTDAACPSGERCFLVSNTAICNAAEETPPPSLCTRRRKL